MRQHARRGAGIERLAGDVLQAGRIGQLADAIGAGDQQGPELARLDVRRRSRAPATGDCNVGEVTPNPLDRQRTAERNGDA
jgi:hypothetical protein